MPAFDRLLTDPPADEVVRVMLEAVETANRRCRDGLMKPNKDDYERFVATDFVKPPEGARIWQASGSSGTTYVASRQTVLGLAWWTTPQGRRLVRIVGRRPAWDDYRHDARFGPPEGGWPPLALLDPGPAMLRSRPGQPAELLMLCGCGALGKPQELGWVGERCGPCQDHQEEHGTPLPQVRPPRWLAPGPLDAVAWAPSGRTIAGFVRYWSKHGMPGEMVFWDAATGAVREQYPFEMHSQIYEAAFATGGTVVTGGPHFELTVWDIETGKKLFSDRSGQSLECMAITPDGRTLACDNPQGLVACDVPQKTELRLRWPGRTGWERTEALAFSPDGRVLAAGREKRHVALVDWEIGGERLLAEGGGQSHCVKALAFSPDGRFLVAGSGPGLGDPYDIKPAGYIDVYQVSDGKHLAAWPACEVYALAFSPDGKCLFTGGTDRLLRVYDVPAWQPAWVLDGHVGAIVTITFSPDGQTLTTASADGTIRFWPWQRLLGEERPPEKPKARPARKAPAAKKSPRRRGPAKGE